ncbi:hypothetical protein F2981_26110 (plasmid) [Sinorhizobium meliloti]|nr:hypothetical protein [Sinorhizobium meliloti]
MDVTAETQASALLEQRVQERTAELTRPIACCQIHADEQTKIEAGASARQEAAEQPTRPDPLSAAASHDLLQPINARNSICRC